MIYKLRRRFIRLSALSVMLVFCVIFLLLFFSGRGQLNDAMDTLTEAIADNGGEFPRFDATHPPPEGHSPFGGVITEESRYSTRFFTVWLDEQGQVQRCNVESIFSITEEQTQDYTQRALKKGREKGWVDDYRYRFFETELGRAVVFVDGSMNRRLTDRFSWTTGLVFVGSWAIIVLLIVLLSRRTVRPIAESYEKQRQFVTDAGHELKTPLALILSNVDIVEAETGGSEWLDDIRSEGERMNLLIRQLTELARMDEEQPGLTFASFDLSECVLDTVSEFQCMAQERGKSLEVQAEPGVCCRGDEGMIRRLLCILLDNALKYCDEGGHIEVNVTRGRHPVLTVENSCSGVEQLELDKLFDRFYRADKARTFNGSFGLGLPIARAIVVRHRGELTAYRRAGIIGFRAELR